MAHVENTVMDVYYRNDSMKSVRVGVVSWVLAEGFAGAKPWGSGSTNKVDMKKKASLDRRMRKDL